MGKGQGGVATFFTTLQFSSITSIIFTVLVGKVRVPVLLFQSLVF